MSTKHQVRVSIQRIDQEDPIDAGKAHFTGKDYETFDGAQARAELIADNRLVLGERFVEFGDVIVPIDKVERIEVTIEAKTKV